MQLFRHYEHLPEDCRGGVVAVGNFDGLHRGHRALIGRAGRLAGEQNEPLAVLTFEPHPRQVFLPDGPPFRITPFRSKARLMSTLGVDVLLALRFSRDLQNKPAETFVRDVLRDGLGARHVVVGYDFAFGHKRSGNVETLRQLGPEMGFDVSVLEPVTHGDDVCSSSIIRVNLETGRARRAAELMGHWWEVEGRVMGGERRGRQLGFPTANLRLHRDALRPALGVYAVHFGLERDGGTEWHKGVANLGQRPTFGGIGVNLEVHIFDFQADIYGQHARVAFVEHLRPERKFNGLDEIKAQIARDSAQAREVLANPQNALDVFSSVPASFPAREL